MVRREEEPCSLLCTNDKVEMCHTKVAWMNKHELLKPLTLTCQFWYYFCTFFLLKCAYELLQNIPTMRFTKQAFKPLKSLHLKFDFPDYLMKIVVSATHYITQILPALQQAMFQPHCGDGGPLRIVKPPSLYASFPSPFWKTSSGQGEMK